MNESEAGLSERRSTAAGVAAPRLRERDVVEAYARWAPIYDAVFGRLMDGSRRTAVEALSADTGRVLELGVGTGISLPHYPSDMRVTGIDLSPEMLEIARRRVRSEELRNVEAILEMDASATSFPDASFDAVMAMYVMTVVPEPDKVLAEIRRLLRPGGRLLVVSHFAADGGPRALFSHLFAPLFRALGWNARITAASLKAAPGMRFISDRPAGLFGFYRLLEFEVV
ncbi:class I SAM-dependent methyltransferase [Methylobrevis pamukkalensis]|uniref:Putative methyltransferase YcgJ n=1 Tax=Methylobrevis pamukkalensis TaxID=1439726 RepID=A0A1E3GXD9_9HYPH|nr:methyltransferase domain-containing protein [Methylobrevis pamukkalensis]ODN68722.1 putative methyltransferase YcgJ [Methylobrevis pamukkalensis]